MRLQVMQRDGYRCVICGANPVTTPGVKLEVDHYDPFSKGGACQETNFQTLCLRCNRGKGNDETLNKVLSSDVDNLLDHINPEIRQVLDSHGQTFVVANTEDFVVLDEKNRLIGAYVIEPTNDTIIGYRAMANAGIYTVNDNHGGKTRFRISQH